MTPTPHRNAERHADRRRFIAWVLIGIVAGLVFQAIQANALGGWTGLLEVGEAATIRPYIEERLPGVVTVPGGGHDGQVVYVIATDLTGQEIPSLINGAGYRYRRILYPALASLGGALDGQAVLVGMILLAAFGMGLAAAAIADLANTEGASRWAISGVIANPGMWLAVQVLTPDALGAGLSLTGLALWMRRRPAAAVVLFSLGGLAKEQFLLIPIAIIAYEVVAERSIRRAAIVALSGVPTVLWALVTQVTIGEEGLSPRGNFTIPFAGIWESISQWGNTPTRDIAFGALTLIGLAIAIVVSIRLREHAIGWILGAWAGLAVISSDWVWGFGNNAARVFSIIWVLIGLALATQAANSRSADLTVRTP